MSILAGENKKAKLSTRKKLIVVVIVVLLIGTTLFYVLYLRIPKEAKPDTSLNPPEYSPLPEDWDGDGIKNALEALYGTDPYNPDSDGDGIWDGYEINWNIDIDGDGYINALDMDSDGDDLLDGVEDKNLNGIVDVGETSYVLADTDSDCLLDGVEDFNLNGIVDEGEPNPLDNDTDDDGLMDGLEIDWNADSDNDTIINVLDLDSDSDTLLDGDEFYVYNTSPINNDTDYDGVADNVELIKGTNPLDSDTDNDGLIDGIEATNDAYWIEAEQYVIDPDMQLEEDINATNNLTVQSLPDGRLIEGDLPINLTAGHYKLFLRVKAVYSIYGAPYIDIGIIGDNVDYSDRIFLTYVNVSAYLNVTDPNIYRWYSTRLLNVSQNESLHLVVNASLNDVIFIDRLLLYKIKTIKYIPTDPLVNDTDMDGLLDGDEETIESYWWEAEDYAYDETQIIDNSDWSNGKGVINLENGSICRIEDENAVFMPSDYSIYARIIEEDPYNDTFPNVCVVLHIDYIGGGEKIIPGIMQAKGPYPRGRWIVAYFNGCMGISFFTLDKPAKLTIELDIVSTAWEHVFVDKIALMNLRFNRSRYLGHIYDYDLVPRAKDPMDPDTDGDQYRVLDGVLPNSTGYLTDGFEWNLGMNPMGIDTDFDNLFNFSAFLTDDFDPNPFDSDSDGDGLFDWIEDFNLDGKWNASHGETNYLDADTDDDGIIDGNEDWNYDGLCEFWETDPLLNDTDYDHLIDGYEIGLWRPQKYGIGTSNWPYRSIANRTIHKTNPTNWDTDGDGLPDGWVDFNNNSIMDPGEYEDKDLDGMTNYGAWRNGTGFGETDPTSPDSDGDYIWDNEEIDQGLNPIVFDYPDLEITPSDLKVIPKRPTTPKRWEYIGFTIGVTIGNIGNNSMPSWRHKRLFKIEVLAFNNVSGYLSSIGYSSSSINKIEPGGSVYMEVQVCLRGGYYNITIEVKARAREKSKTNNRATIQIHVYSPPEAYPYLDLEGYNKYGYAVIEENRTNVSVIGIGEDLDGEIAYYMWDFDMDGIWDFVSNETGNTTIVISQPGKYTFRFRVVDNDGLFDESSVTFQLVNPSEVDSDGDGLTDKEEADVYGTDIYNADTDGDGLSDSYEIEIDSSPVSMDTDSDGIDDWLETALFVAFGYNASQKRDNDGDGLIDIRDNDSDNDGLLDGYEIRCIDYSNPFDIRNWIGMNPYLNDSDYDGLSDYQENKTYRSNPLNPDSDGDGLTDYEEVVFGTNIWNQDTDNDGVKDGYDIQPFLNYPYQPFTFTYATGEIRYNTTIHVFGFNGSAWKDVGYGWIPVDPPPGNVKTSKINPASIGSLEAWGSFAIEDLTYIGRELKHRVMGISCTVPVNWKVIYYLYSYNYNASFYNKEPIWLWAESHAIFPVYLYNGRNQTVSIQFIAINDESFVGDGNYRYIAFTYDIFKYEDIEISNGKISEVYSWPLYSETTPATRLYGNVYQVDISIPIEYTHLGRVYLRIKPIWIEHFRNKTRIITVPYWRINITSMAHQVFLPNGKLVIGRKTLRDFNNTIDTRYFEPSTYQKHIHKESDMLSYANDTYLYEVHASDTYFLKNQDASTVMLLFTSKDTVSQSTSVETFINSLPSKVKSRETTINLFRTKVNEMLSKASKKYTVQVIAAITKHIESLSFTYDNVKMPSILELAFDMTGDILGYSEDICDVLAERFIKYADTFEKAAKIIGKISFGLEIAETAIYIGLLAQKIMETNDPHLQKYYAVKMMFAIARIAIEVALEIILPEIGGYIIAAIDIIIEVFGLDEYIEQFQRWIVACWEALTGECPEEFARQMYEKACRKIIDLVSKGPDISVMIVPRYK